MTNHLHLETWGFSQYVNMYFELDQDINYNLCLSFILECTKHNLSMLIKIWKNWENENENAHT